MKRILLSLLLSAVLLAAEKTAAQLPVSISTRDLAADYRIRPDFLDDTAAAGRYVDSIAAAQGLSAAADTCVTVNARALALENSLHYEYRLQNDTVWITPTLYIGDYPAYKVRLGNLHTLLLRRAHRFVYSRSRQEEELLEADLSRLRDTIDRTHRLIVNTTDGIGVTDKERKKELKDIFYAYISVYNRFDFSMRQGDSLYKADLERFFHFQESLIQQLLGNDNLPNRIRQFPQQLKARCGSSNADVFRSYQRNFNQEIPAIHFSTIKGYERYETSLRNHLQTQQYYIDAVTLREKITEEGRQIARLYSPQFRETARAYQEAEKSATETPAFSSLEAGTRHIGRMQEFLQVQKNYRQDYLRLIDIIAHGDSITRKCAMKYSDIAKAYRQLNSRYFLTPNYRTPDEAAQFGSELDKFETMQRIYDSIFSLRLSIDEARDSVAHDWMAHFALFNGLQQQRKKAVLTPAFISVEDGEKCLNEIRGFARLSEQFVGAVRLLNRYKKLDSQVEKSLRPYKNAKKAYKQAEQDLLTVKDINTPADLEAYAVQLASFATVQQAFLDCFSSSDAAAADSRLRGVRKTDNIKTIIGL